MNESISKPFESSECTYNAEGLILAPNGEVSRYQNLELQKKIRSKEFLLWFGDWVNHYNDTEVSRAVFDDTHEPILFKHRTNERYTNPDYPSTNYDKTFGGVHGLPKKAVYFTTSDLIEYGKIIYYCFLNIRNPSSEWSEISDNSDGCIVDFSGNKNGYHAAVFSDAQILVSYKSA